MVIFIKYKKDLFFYDKETNNHNFNCIQCPNKNNRKRKYFIL